MKNGFTLVELAIVIVIIGLLVGGVLQGKDLIEQAKIRSQIVQLKDFERASLTFYAKYNCLAGDCTKAVTLLGAEAINGNGNQELDNVNIGTGYDIGNTTWENNNEYRQFFIQLSKANMVKETFDGSRTIGKGLPALSIKNSATFLATSSASFETSGRTPSITNYKTGRNAFFLTVCNTSATRINNWDDDCGIFTPMQAYQIDAKIDDGKALSGVFFGFGGPASYTNNDCLNNGVYKVSNESTVQCQAAYVFDK